MKGENFVDCRVTSPSPGVDGTLWTPHDVPFFYSDCAFISLSTSDIAIIIDPSRQVMPPSACLLTLRSLSSHDIVSFLITLSLVKAGRSIT